MSAMTATSPLQSPGATALSPELAEKLVRVRASIGAFNGALVAYSGGVDSTVLARIAFDVLGDRALACTAVSAVVPAAERELATRIARQIGIRHRLLGTHELKDEAFVQNTPNRCYVCKGALFVQLHAEAEREGLEAILYGANTDDAGDYRPGARAALEAGVHAPLAEARLSKAEVRELARFFGLPNADKPAAPCLATRIPYGRRVTVEALGQIERGELALRRLGFSDVRVRHHGNVARVELPVGELTLAAEDHMREVIVRELRAAGFQYVALDLLGFRSGSMNEALTNGTGDNHG